jgi:membrane-associated phospholipid phosphatase
MDWDSIQVAVNLILQGLGGWLEVPMNFFSFLGREEFFLFIMPALYWCISPALGIRTALALLFSSALNAALKIIFHQPRPYWLDPRIEALSAETSFGLPSNHAQNAVVIWGQLGKASRKSWFMILAAVLIFFIGVSRLYLGVHFLGDVLGGWVFGGIFLILLIRLDHPMTTWLSRQPFRVLLACSALGSLVVVLLVVVPGVVFRSWPIPQVWLENALAAIPQEPIAPYSLDPAFTLGGTWLGMFSGAAWLFRKGGGYQAKGTPLQRILRYLIGLAGVFVLWYGLGQLFPRTPDLTGYLLRYGRYALIGLWIALLAPLLFRRLRLCA